MVQMIAVPVKLLRQIAETERTLRFLSSELEDFFLARDPAFLKKMRSARRSHRAGKTRSLQDFLAV